MNTRKYMFKNSLVACFACCCISFASAGNPPFFPTDVVANAKGELLMTDKGVKRVDVFSPDGKTLLRSFPMDEAPTGILLDGDKAYVTTFGTTGHLQILSLESGRVEASIPTGSGACHPMFGPDKKHIYVCNQFQTTISEIDPVARKVMRTVKVLREPKSAVFSKDGKYMFVTNFLPAQRADHRNGWLHEGEGHPVGKRKQCPSGNLYNSRRQIYICIAQLGAFHRPYISIAAGMDEHECF